MRASLPGAYGTLSVSRKGNRNDRPNKRGMENDCNRGGRGELKRPDSEDEVNISAARPLKVCFFHGQPPAYPHKITDAEGC